MGCSRSSGQLFHWDNGMIKVSQDPRYCVVIDGNQNRDGANIQLWECDPYNSHMRWSSLDNFLVANSNGKCMVVDNNHAYNGANVQLWSCQGYEYYKGWVFGYCKGPGCSMLHGSKEVQLRGSSAKNDSDSNVIALPVSAINDTAPSTLRTMHSTTQYGEQFYFKADAEYCLSVDGNSFH